MKLQKVLTLALALGAVFNAPQISAVFYQAQKFEHPATGNQVVLFSDIHVDINSGFATRIQQHDLLREAKKQNALILAEDNAELVRFNNKSNRVYSAICGFTIGAGIGLAVTGLFIAAEIYKRSINRQDTIKFGMITLPSSIFITTLITYLWRQHKEWNELVSPPFSIDEYIAALNKKYAPTKLLNLDSSSPLFHLSEQAKRQGIQAVNIEFRNLGPAESVQSCGLLKLMQIDNWIMRKLTGNKMRYPVTVKDYYQTRNKIRKEIASYNDGQIPKDFYNQCIADYRTSNITKALRTLAELDNWFDNSLPISTLLRILSKKQGDQKTIASNLGTPLSKLLDARVVHQICKNRSKKKIFVCIGGNHAKRISPMLERMGYKDIGLYTNQNLTSTLDQMGRRIIDKKIPLKDFEDLVLDLKKVFAT